MKVSPSHSSSFNEILNFSRAHFNANTAVQFPGPNSFLQMMCHYNKVYLNKFNTSLIKPERVFKGHTANQDHCIAHQGIHSEKGKLFLE